VNRPSPCWLLTEAASTGRAVKQKYHDFLRPCVSCFTLGMAISAKNPELGIMPGCAGRGQGTPYTPSRGSGPDSTLPRSDCRRSGSLRLADEIAEVVFATARAQRNLIPASDAAW
jgi:hypothetical protein